MELSIIVSAYNMAEDTRLENCLNSLLEQTISDYEIIAVDDASTDGTSQILLDFAALYPDVFKVIQSRTHKGRGGARNMGMKHAHGKWLAFVESWDQVAPTMYEKLLAKANDTGADLVGCGYCITSEDTDSQAECVQTLDASLTGILDTEKRKSLLLDFGGLCTKIYKRKVVLDCGMAFPEEILGEDKVMECAIALRAKHFEYVEEPLYICESPKKVLEFEKKSWNTSDKTECVLNVCVDYIEAARLLLQFAQDFGYLDDYHREIEYKYTELAYIKPLIYYLKEAKDKKVPFLKVLKQEIKATFPRFEWNVYYKGRIGEAERMVIRIHQCSNRLLLWWCRCQVFLQNLKKGGWKQLGVEGLSLLLGILLCFGLVSMVVKDRKTEQYEVVILGDSLVANDYVGDELDEMLSKAWNTEVFNGGFGGTQLCNPNTEGYESYGEESLSLEELTNSIITGDFLVQKSVIKKISKLDYYENRLDALSKIDFEKTRILIIEHGVNDYLQQTAPAQVEFTLRDVIQKLQKRYPDLQIWVCSPTFCYIVKDGERLDCDTTELGEFVLEEYILAEERVCKELGVGFVNNYHQDIITKKTIEQYVLDGLHLNEEGRRIVAENILEAIKPAEQ